MTRLDDCEIRLKLWEPVHGPVLLVPTEDYRYLINLGRSAEAVLREWTGHKTLDEFADAVDELEKVYYSKPDPEKENLDALRPREDEGIPEAAAAPEGQPDQDPA